MKDISLADFAEHLYFKGAGLCIMLAARELVLACCGPLGRGEVTTNHLMDLFTISGPNGSGYFRVPCGLVSKITVCFRPNIVVEHIKTTVVV